MNSHGYIGFQWLESKLRRWPRSAIQGLCLALVLIAGWIDYGTGTEVISLNLYLLPLVLGAWFLERRDGLHILLMTSIVYSAADLFSGSVLQHPLIHAWNGFSMISFFAMIFGLTRQLHAFINLQNSLARVDLVTEIANQVAFEEALRAEIGRKKRLAGPTSVAIVAIDRPDSTARTLAGDEWRRLLRQTAQTISLNLRTGELAATLENERFGFLIPDVTPKNFKKVLEKIHYALNGMAATHEWPCTFRISATTFTTLPSRAKDVLDIVGRQVDDMEGKSAVSFSWELISARGRSEEDEESRRPALSLAGEE